MGLHEEVPRRSSAVSKKSSNKVRASKLLSAMKLVELRQAEFGRYCEDNLDERCCPRLAIDASSKLGILRRV